MSDKSFEAIGCLAALVTAVVVVPIYLSALVYSAPTTIAFTIFAAAVARYTWPDWKHWFISSDQRSNNYTSTRKAKNPSQEEIEETKKFLLGKPDIDCKPSKSNGLTIEDSIKIHLRRLRKYGYSVNRGETEFMGPRGGIYTITASGNRNYR